MYFITESHHWFRQWLDADKARKHHLNWWCHVLWWCSLVVLDHNGLTHGFTLWWCHVTSTDLVNIGSRNGLLHGSIMQLSAPILSYHQWGPLVLIWQQFDMKSLRHQSLKYVSKIANTNLMPHLPQSIGLTDWGPVTHICVSKLTIIVSYYGLLPEQCQAIIWTNNGILLNVPLETNFSENLIEIQTFALKKSISKCCLENGGHFDSASMC